MRILVATHNYPRFRGDHAGSFVARLMTRLAARGHAIRVVAPHAPGIPTAETIDGVEVHRFRYGPEAIERVAYRGDLHQRSAFELSALVGVPAMLASYAAVLRREVRRFRPDIVHAHWWFPGGTLAVFGAASGVPVVVTCHGSDVRLLDRGGPIAALGAHTLRRAAAVTCVSDFLRHDVEQNVPELRGKVRTIYMPVDTLPFDAARGTPKADPPVVLFVGNLVPSKGISVLVDAFATLRAQGVRCRLRIIGRGVQEASLRRQIDDRGVASEVELAGFVPHDRIASEYAAAHVVVLPSRGQGEGLGLVLAEALLSGSAVVGSPAGGIPEVVRNGETGLIARDGDADDLARAIRRLLEDTALARRLTDAGAAHVRAMFAPEAVASAFEDVFRAATRTS